MIDYRNKVEPKLRGMWQEFFESVGINVGAIKGVNSKNMPCPLCGGDDRAHYRDVDGRLSLYCRSCAADSMKAPEQVYMEATGRSFAEFVQDAANFVSFVPNEVIAAKVVQRKTLREPTYCASLPESECRKVINANPDALPVLKRIDGKLVVCNVAMPDGSFASGKYSSLGFSLIGKGSVEAVTHDVSLARWFAEKFECRVVWCLNVFNLREMLRVAKKPVRVISTMDFDALCEIEKGNADQIVEIFDMNTGLTAKVEAVERLIDDIA